MHYQGAPSACSWRRLGGWLGAASTHWYHGMLCWSVQVDDDSSATVTLICTKAIVVGGEWTGGGSSGQKCVCGMKKCLQETSMGENVVCTKAVPHAHLQCAPSLRTRHV